MAIDNEVATLIISTLPRVLDNLILAQLRQVTETRADHDWDFANGHLILLENGRLCLDFRLAREWVLISILDLEDLHGTEHFSLVRQIADPSSVRHDGLVTAVTFMKAWELVDYRAAKYDLVRGLFIIVAEILAALVNGLLPKLIDNLLH